MFRSPVFTILIAIALGASGVRIYELTSQVAELTSQNQDLQARYENLQNELLQAHEKEDTARMGQESMLDQLLGRIATQKDLLASAGERLRKLGNEGPAGKDLGGLREKLQAEGQVIADLNQQIHDVRQHEAQLRNQDKFYQQQAGVSQRQSDQDLKMQIAQQQQALQQLTNQLKHFKVNPWDQDSTDAYASLQAQVEAQKSTIQQLKDQRASNGAQWGYQKAQSHSQNEQNLADLKASEDALQAQLQREKAAQAGLQHDIQSGVQTQSSQNALVRSAQADYETQKAKLQDLQNQLQVAQQQLQSIAGGSGGGGGNSGK